jgi:NSS family neurotransmitter:Na+ symporter
MNRPHWKSRLGFLLAVIGSAVGLGNVWRFPFVAYKNGGGAFLIPYFIALVMVGIPLLILEQGLGYMQKGSTPVAYARIRRSFEYLGWWVSILVMFGLVLYYSAVLSWCVCYFFDAARLAWGADPDRYFFSRFLDVSDSPFNIGGIRWPIFLGLIFIWFVNWLVIARGIRKGIELANKVGMPLLFVTLLVLLFWSMSLPGAEAGVSAFLTPDMGSVFSPSVWNDAFAQIFFTLSLGSGAMIVYASYLPDRSQIGDNAVLTATANSAVEIMAGFAVFSILGYLAFVRGVAVSDVVVGGPGLAFVAYPHAINNLPFGREAFGMLFFAALFIAGITSSVAMVETFVSAAIDKFGWKRWKVTTVVSIIGFAGSAIFATSAGILWLDIIDHMVCNVGMIAVGFLEAVLVAWVFGGERFIARIERYSKIKLGRFFVFCAKIFIPVVLLGLFVSDIVKNSKEPYGGYPWLAIVVIGLGWLAATLVAARYFTKAKWNTDHLSKRYHDEGKPLIVEVEDSQ